MKGIGCFSFYKQHRKLKMELVISENTKLVFHNNEYSSQEIIQNVDIISSYLPENESSNCILLYLDRTPEMIYAILSVLKKGLTYVPVNINTPNERLRYIIENSGCRIVLTTKKYKNRFKELKTICIDDIKFKNDKSNSTLTSAVNSQNVAYIIYTSGTTGYPKGVSISYGAIKNFIKAFQKRIGCIEKDNIIFLTDVSFDISFVEIVYAAIVGMIIVIADEEECRNPKSLIKLIKNNNVTTLQLTPSRVKLIGEVDEKFDVFHNIKRLLIGGEIFPMEMLKKLNEYTKCKIYNLYGPTEATIWTSVAELTNENAVNIGKPLENMEIYIVDDDINPVSNGEKGEILISGAGLALGYVNDSKLTSKNFVCPSFLNGKKAYLTGDIGYYDKNGQIIFVGRNDNQIKINGYRIELEEIESVLNSYHKIQNSIVGVENNKLVAVYIEKDTIDFEELKRFIKLKLPDYMIPLEFRKIEKFLYTDSMKIDRKAVLKSGNPENCPKSIELLDQTESSIINIVKENIDSNKEVYLESRFEDLGLDSLDFVQIIVSIEEKFDFEIEDEMLTTSAFLTINSLVQYVKSRKENVKLKEH